MNAPRETKVICEATGEFVQRDLHVVAKVKLVNDVVECVTFNSSEPQVSECAQAVSGWLCGKSLTNALQVGVEDCSEFCADREAKVVVGVMLEAFHRSLEETLE